MRPGPYFIITLLLIAGSILVYHNAVGEPGRSPSVDRHVSYDDPDPDPASSGSPSNGSDTLLLNGGGNETWRKSVQAQLDRLSDDMRAVMQRISESGGSNRPATDSGGNTSGSAPLPSLSPRDIVDTDDPVFDEETLEAFGLYMAEVNRRQQEERQRTRVRGDLARLDLGLTEKEQEAVVNETVRFQQRRVQVMRKQYAPDDAGREARRTADQEVRDEYASVIKRLVPEDSAEKILKSRVARGVGFFGGAFGGGRVDRSGRRNRKR